METNKNAYNQPSKQYKMNEVLFKHPSYIHLLMLKVFWQEKARQFTPVFELYTRLSWPEAIEKDIFKLPGPTSTVSFWVSTGRNSDLPLPE